MAGLIARTGERPVTLTHYRHRGVPAFRATVSLGKPSLTRVGLTVQGTSSNPYVDGNLHPHRAGSLTIYVRDGFRAA
jgi:hypothetical protein